MRLDNPLRTYHTLKHLGAKQGLYYLFRRLGGYSSVRLPREANRREGLGSISFFGGKTKRRQALEFKFLNVRRRFTPNAIDWSPDGVSRLWLYNLHYFDYLQDANRTDDEKALLINSWIEKNPQGEKNAWEPYTTSLRITNWIKYFQSDAVSVTDAWMLSLYEQARWLRKNLEYHILANHYFENIKAIAFAGSFFKGEEADEWLTFGVNELKRQLIEQNFADGGHYERSPLYHCIMLINYFDLYQLAESNQAYIDSTVAILLESVIQRGMNFLQDITHSDGHIPLFNDSAFGIAPEPAELFKHGEKLGFNVSGGSERSIHLIERPESGFYGVKNSEDSVVISCGDIAPSYQPGHMHCDFLSYELYLEREAVVVDTGVYEYEPGYMRHYVRSSRAHNTCVVDRGEQSDIWAEFRVGRRARKLFANLVKEKDKVVFDGAYAGYYQLDSAIVHRRRMEVMLSPRTGRIQGVQVTDWLMGKGEHEVENFIHLHPSVQLQEDGGRRVILEVDKRPVSRITFSPDTEYELLQSFYCPEFGKKINRNAIVTRKKGPLPLKMCYLIERYERPGGVTSRLH